MMKLMESRIGKTIWGQRLIFSLLYGVALCLVLYRIKPNPLTPIIVLIVSSIPIIPILMKAYRADKKRSRSRLILIMRGDKNP